MQLLTSVKKEEKTNKQKKCVCIYIYYIHTYITYINKIHYMFEESCDTEARVMSATT